MRLQKPVFWMIQLLLFCSCAANSNASIDGNWWMEKSAEQREAFYSGYYSCYIYDVGFRDLPEDKLAVESVTEYYKTHSDKRSELVWDVFRKIDAIGPRRTRAVPADNKYGDTDGEYWRLISNDARLEYVRGYVACQGLHTTAQFSKPAEEYVKAVSKWYGTSANDLSKLSEKTANDKVPVVLLGFQNKQL